MGRTRSSSCTGSSPGGADKSYGIHVARLAGVPRSVIERAKQILARLEEEHLGENGRPKIAVKGKRSRRGDLQLTSSPRRSTRSWMSCGSSISMRRRRSERTGVWRSCKGGLSRSQAADSAQTCDLGLIGLT